MVLSLIAQLNPLKWQVILMLFVVQPESEAGNSYLLTKKSVFLFFTLCKIVGLSIAWRLFSPASRDDTFTLSLHKSDSGIYIFMGYRRCNPERHLEFWDFPLVNCFK